jgi:hypothetical protein
MSARQAAELKQIAKTYDKIADGFEEGSLGRIGNRAEAAKYHDLAARAESWPDDEKGGK